LKSKVSDASMKKADNTGSRRRKSIKGRVVPARIFELHVDPLAHKQAATRIKDK
jgi:hypothetical protein